MDTEQRKNEIKDAYLELGRAGTMYDQMITYSTKLGGYLNKMVWGFTREENDQWLTKALGAIPADFSGRLLEVPVGTGVLTMPVYQRLPDAEIICMDYSENMMKNAESKAGTFHLENVTFRQGDVGEIPYEDESFDLVLTLNGLHAFPDKEAAFRELCRVLRPGGIFCGTLYIRGETEKTDWWIRNVHEKKGFFTPPYETKESLKERLEAQYSSVEVDSVRSLGIFRCIK